MAISVHWIQSSCWETVWRLDFTTFNSKSLCSLSLDQNTVHLYFSYSFSIVYSSLYHFSSMGVRVSASIFTDPWSFSLIRFLTFCPFFTHLCDQSYTVYTDIYLPLQFCITQSYICLTSINPMTSVPMHFVQSYSIYGIISYNISYNSFHIYFHILPYRCVNWPLFALCGVWNLQPATHTTIISIHLSYSLICHINLPFFL